MAKPTHRQAAEACILDLFGHPGAAWDTRDGTALLTGLIRENGLSMLTDAAVIALANRHLELEQVRSGKPIPPLAAVRRERAA